MNRRALLQQLLGLGIAAGLGPAWAAARRPSHPFEPLLGPMPLPGDGRHSAEQRQLYTRIALRDRLEVPPGYGCEVLLQWGDPLGSGRFGFNNDYLAFTPLAGPRALLTVNFEAISPRPWCAGYAEVMGRALPLDELQHRLADRGGRIDATSLAADDPLLAVVREVARAALEDLGIGVAGIEQVAGQGWRRRPCRFDRRITGLSGLEQAQERLRCSGPAAAVFRRQQRLGYDDGLGDQVIGTFAKSYVLRDRDGGRFEQLRRVPLGSNWPANRPGAVPRPGVVAIRRHDGGPLLA